MKRAVIIGASSGMGMEVSRLLLADGWDIGVAARRTEALGKIKEMSPEHVEVEMIDVTADDATDHLLNLIHRMGGLNLFFYAAGIGFQNPQLDSAVEIKTVTTNTLGFTRMVGAAFNYFADNCGGHIAVISSIAGTKGIGVAPSYSATKAFQNKYIEALEQLSNMRHLSIHFTDIRPGFVDTALLGDGSKYPMLMQVPFVAHKMLKAVYSRRHVVVIDWRYRFLTALWNVIPRYFWRKMNIRTSKKEG
jgi:short-subunit dehydrogenase